MDELLTWKEKLNLLKPGDRTLVDNRSSVNSAIRKNFPPGCGKTFSIRTLKKEQTIYVLRII